MQATALPMPGRSTTTLPPGPRTPGFWQVPSVLSRVDLALAPGYRMRPVLRTVTIGPSGGMPVVVVPEAR